MSVMANIAEDFLLDEAEAEAKLFREVQRGNEGALRKVSLSFTLPESFRADETAEILQKRFEQQIAEIDNALAVAEAGEDFE